MRLSAAQRAVLWLLAIFGLVGPNGVFVYIALFRPDDFRAAMEDPITLAFLVEAFIIMGLLAAFWAARPLGRWGWKTFLVLSLLGSLAFSIPAFVLMNSPREGS